MEELEAVLNRDFIKIRFDLSDEAIAEFIYNLRILAEVLTGVPKVFSLERDVDDEPYINLAVQSEADFIVTRDKDLLDLMQGYDATSKKFRQRFRPLKVIEPPGFLKIAKRAINALLSNKP